MDSNARGLIVLVAALVVGFLLLYSWGDDGGSSTTTASVTSTTVDIGDLGSTTTAPTRTTTSGADRAPSEVSVIVLNGSGQAGAAAETSSTIGDAGYTMLAPGNGPSTETTTIYYKADYQQDAIAVGGLLGKGTDAVKPLADASLGGAEGDADVVVVLGSADTPPVSGSTTTTTA